MKRLIQAALSIALLGAIIIFKNDLSNTFIEGYNQCIEFMASHTTNCTQILGV